MKKVILFLSIIAFVSCNKDDGPNGNAFSLPPETQTGANTFGCYIDGKLFIPRDGTGTFNSSDRGMILLGGYPNTTDYYEISIRDFKSERTANLLIHVHELDVIGIGDYIINQSNGLSSIDGLNHTYMHCRVWRDDIGNYQNYLSYENSGIVTITYYSYDMGIISGTFSGSIRNYQEPFDIIEITNGRLDINGYTLPNTEFM